MLVRNFSKTAACMLILVLLASCTGKETTFSGATMGTTYHIKLITGYFKNASGLQAKIDKRLQEINRSMSTYIAESEISRFNALQSTETNMPISEDFFQVLQVGARLYDMTGGAWDGTVRPLVALWGFDGRQSAQRIPDSEAVLRELEPIGFRHIDLSRKGDIRKKRLPLSLDLASIAKGYAVDQIALLLHEEGFRDYLVEIGGEVYAAGVRKNRRPWRVGVNLPEKGASLDAVYDIVTLEDRAMATSGDYRNFFEQDGVVYSHILDPRTGYPVANGVVSVSVIAKDCAFADGLATALMVMGGNEGMALVERLEGVEALIIVRNNNHELEAHASEGFYGGGTSDAHKQASQSAAAR